MKITYEPTGINNFHNCPPISLIVSDDEDDMYLISAGQQKRIQKHFCGMSDCRCAGGACQQLNQEGTVWGIYKKWCSA